MNGLADTLAALAAPVAGEEVEEGGRHYRAVFISDIHLGTRGCKAEFLLDFLDDVVRRRAVLVASGLTAAYAVQVAVDHPELVRGLVLSCPVGIDLASEEPDLKDAVIHRLLKLPIFGTSAMNLVTGTLPVLIPRSPCTRPPRKRT